MSLASSLCRNCQYPNPPENRVCDMCGAPMPNVDAEVVDTDDLSAPVPEPTDGERSGATGDFGRTTGTDRASDQPVGDTLHKTTSRSASLAAVNRVTPGWHAIRLQRRERGFAALFSSLVLFFLGFHRLLAPSATQGSNGPTVPQPASFATSVIKLTRTLTLTASVLNRGVSLSRPQEAVALSDGTVAVADTGNHRVVLLSADGRTVHIIGAGASRFLEPYAVAASRTGVYVLDTQRRTIESFDFRGHFQSPIFSGGVLDHPRGLALGPNGILYVADPASNSIDLVSIRGALIKKMIAVSGLTGGAFHQPSDVAVGAHGTLYTVDNTANRILALTPDGKILGTWAAPSSSTLFSAHVLPLPDGRLLVSDPSGALILYSRRSESATRLILHVPGTGTAPPSPLGISLAAGGRVLITDNSDGKILKLSLPPL